MYQPLSSGFDFEKTNTSLDVQSPLTGILDSVDLEIRYEVALHFENRCFSFLNTFKVSAPDGNL